jgi:hypothetical protein
MEVLVGQAVGTSLDQVDYVAAELEKMREVLRSEDERDDAFAAFVQLRSGVLVIATSVFFNGYLELLAALATRHWVPAIYEYRQVRDGWRPD